jgi:hypothetical protein
MSTPSRVTRAFGALRSRPDSTAPAVVRGRWLRGFAHWLSALLADDGMRARFDSERRRDADLLLRVERKHRP